ncbi:MAG: hypothetical protein Q8L05_09450, partial [Actinomycetota bacterium]|nr:hypothetical protein [Actinomycetota bacterium]
MKGTQRAGLLRLFATVALFLGLVSMHHLSLAQCDDLQHATSASSVAIAAEPAGMAMPVTANSSPSPSHSHSNSALGCACLIAMCLAILAFVILLRPQSPKD